VSVSKFGPDAAAGWTETSYADPASYLGRRAELVLALGPPLVDGDRVLDLACGDAGLAEFLLPHGLDYLGVDASPPMVAAAGARLAGRGTVETGSVDSYRPPTPVAATTVFRALYYATDRAAFFRRAAEFTEKKLVFDMNPRQYRVAEIRAELEANGWGRIELRPFFVPQTVALPRAVLRALGVAERIPPLARTLLRFRFTYVCAAWRDERRGARNDR
jgi:SAM-dependent methyltransferase